MKVLFTADLHIKVGQKNVPREWQKNRYLELFNKLTKIDCDMIVLGGDIFDKVPNMEELELYFELISLLDKPTIIFDGNHEASRKGKTFLHNLSNATTNLNPKVQILDDIHTIDNMDFIPYTRIKNFDPKLFHGNILFTHVRGEIKPHVKPEINLDNLNRWDIVFAGDLHSHSNSQRNIVYPGSPISTSFHRSPIKNGVITLDSETLEYEWIELDLPQLIRKTVSTEDEIIKTEYDHTIYEFIGDIIDIGNISTDSNLLDKKIISKNSEASLNLSDLSITQELALYLKKILKLDEDTVESILGTHNDYIKET